MSEFRNTKEIEDIIKLSNKFNHMECAAKMYDLNEGYQKLKRDNEKLKKSISCYYEPIKPESRSIEEWQKCSLFWESQLYAKRDEMQERIDKLELALKTTQQAYDLLKEQTE